MSEILIPIVTALCGGGISTLVLLSVRKRKENAEAQTIEQSNQSAVAEEWVKLYKEQSDRLEKVREEKKELWDEYSRCKEQLAYFRTCHCKNYSCANRKPPLGELERCIIDGETGACMIGGGCE